VWEWRYSSTLLTSALDGSDWTASHPGCLLPGKEPLAHTTEEPGWAPEQVWMLWSTEKCLAPARNQTLAIQPIVHRYTDWATPSPHRLLACFSQDKSTVHCQGINWYPVYHVFWAAKSLAGKHNSDTCQRLQETGTAIPQNKEHGARRPVTAEECILD
jgi:hypothetical protein